MEVGGQQSLKGLIIVKGTPLRQQQKLKENFTLTPKGVLIEILKICCEKKEGLKKTIP